LTICLGAVRNLCQVLQRCRLLANNKAGSNILLVTTAENGSQLEKAAAEHWADFVGNSGTRKWLRFGIF
jgi:hypothetical protein